MKHKVERGILRTAHLVETGDTVYMGKYPVSSRGSRDSLEWRVLAKEGDRFLLISASCIEWMPFHAQREVTWENSILRATLAKLYRDAFSPREQKLILLSAVRTSRELIQIDEDAEAAKLCADAGVETRDHLFLLSVYEAHKYFADDDARKAIATPYVLEKGGYINREHNATGWWLRTRGYQASYASDVLPWGEICGIGEEVYEEGGIRPAMWVRFESQANA